MEVETAAVELRAGLTPAEARLWEAIRDCRLDGLRFRRQHRVGRFILGFYCPLRRLVVEVGPQGASRDDDHARTAALAAFGFHVLRFGENDVLDHLPAVIETIRETARVLAGQRGRVG